MRRFVGNRKDNLPEHGRGHLRILSPILSLLLGIHGSVSVDASGSGANLEAGRKHWAFQPITQPALPIVRRAAWVKSPIDTFILARLEAHGLTPAAPADRRALIRRATFDLTGLPPTPDEVESFLLDNSVDALPKLVDRLLDSPHYGERWGRHWLDVARYADSNGLDENIVHGNAWRYRDYVVNAFNRDKPFDQFIIEQVAGDLLPPAPDLSTKQDRLIATGFLSLGAKVLAEPDPKKMEMDIIDEQIDTLGRAFMGLTLGCARCHDHKFDPLPTEDYYALAAIFKSTRTMNNFKIVAEWHEPSLATPEEISAREAHDKQVAAKKDAIAKVTSQANETLRTEARVRALDYLVAAAKLPPKPATNEVETVAGEAGLRAPFLKNCREFLAKAETNAVFRAWHGAVQRGSAASEEIDKVYRRRLAEMEQALQALKDETGSTTNALADPELEAVRQALDDPKGFLALPAKPEALYPAATGEELKRLRDDLAAFEKGAPELPSTMGVTDATNVVRSLAVHVRGSHLNLGAEAPRGFPRVLVTANPPAQFNDQQSGRLELARWLASPDHPLTARVMANRIWRWHFGQGLVASTENFGALGERPSHPELLDWLAARFVSSGWSVKALHRLIMTSATYQQAASPHVSSHTEFFTDGPGNASGHLADANDVDPENRLLSRFNVRRLEAEEIRDALLAVAGMLDRTRGGKTIPLKNREFVFNHTSKDATTYESVRRALYLPIIRNHLYDLFDQFDYPDPAVPTGSRNETVIAPQALLMLNADLVAQAAERLARQLIDAPRLTDRQKLEWAYLKAYARPPTEREIRRAQTFLAEFERTADAPRVEGEGQCAPAWSSLCHAILAANEFSYLN
jgi:hypothetical protein